MQNDLLSRLEAMRQGGQDNLLLRFSLGKAYAEQERYQEAASELEAALAHDPDYGAAWKWLGRARLALNDMGGARMAWEEGVVRAENRGDKQLVKEMQVFLKRLDKAGA
ncbi:tetratricopeptide repeat protein [Kerstersia similis]|uniref:tetratricopeptide repeat protein n=1 Tax=Kerstersia similis TaxID=206505 RepID=UPI0039F02A60